ncbi:glycerol-3-phosphate responsive antiterminator [Pontibacillus salicampi]|uniref:Glycerol uptake operon antiterminator regulatory protein n=1 Tax=Pontibacillus salicampi TaxID=1449801 RepID=A0ABV6LT47_9BACI
MSDSPRLREWLAKDRLIASIKDPKAMDAFLKTDIKIAFLLFGNISVIGKFVKHLKEHDRMVYVHLDKIQGISHDAEGLKFLHRFVAPYGIITTKSHMVQKAKKLNLSTIQRLFLVDTDAIKNGLASMEKVQPDAVEIMPALIPSMVSELKLQTDVPLVTGGLLTNPNQMREALEYGASAVSTGNPGLWDISYTQRVGSEWK